MLSLIKNIGVIIGLLALAALGYYLFVLERGSTINPGVSSAVQQSEVEAEEFLSRLRDIENIEISTAVFDDERFRSLVNFSSVVDRVPVGRENPFSRP